MSGGESWREGLYRYIAEQAKPVEKFGHQARLYQLTQQIGAGLDYDDDVVYAAAWLHDLGVFFQHRPEDPEALARWDNVRYALKKSPEVLTALGFPAHKIPAVLEAIRTHQASANPHTAEATVLRDADILEQLGAVGILRAVCKVGRDTRYATFSDVVPVLRNALENLPGTLRLPVSQRIAEAKVRLLRDFLAGIEREADPALF